MTPETARRLLAAGDIASCSSTADEKTAALVERLPGTVAVLGDAVYELGTTEEFERCYSWRNVRARTRAALGNHEYGTGSAAAAIRYFGLPERGYYSYELGRWHVVVVNSNCEPAGGCEDGSPQQRWLRADLARNRRRCTLAYWHHARFSSGLHGPDATMDAIWRTLYAARADVVLSGHDHHYERFAPQSPAGRLDRARGIRQFVVGTGGRSSYPILRVAPNSEVRRTGVFGVLELTLLPDRYRWRFRTAAGGRFTDSGSARCR